MSFNQCKHVKHVGCLSKTWKRYENGKSEDVTYCGWTTAVLWPLFFPGSTPLDLSISGNKCWKYTPRLFINVCDKFDKSFKTW